jgi:hypothetical protein
VRAGVPDKHLYYFPDEHLNTIRKRVAQIAVPL